MRWVIGNWKMHGDGRCLADIDAIAAEAGTLVEVQLALCVPATLIHRAANLGTDLIIGGQDCHHASDGAYTGAVSATMLREAGAQMVILGHSERRAAGDSDVIVAAKVASARAAGLRAVVCVGETADERAAGNAVTAACRQLIASLPDEETDDLIVAYEPVWAIGGDAAPTLAEIAPIVAGLRATLTAVGRDGSAVLYGGSATAATVPAMLASGGVDGLLVGRASLSVAEFTAIARAAHAASAEFRPRDARQRCANDIGAGNGKASGR